MKVVAPDADGLAEAAKVILRDEVVAYPTETVYGLGANPCSEAAVDRIFTIKGRKADHAILLIVAEPEHAARIAEISAKAQAYIDAFWPGPLSLILPAAAIFPETLTGGRGTLCLRCPACEIARGLCRAVDGPLTSTSANLSGGAPAQRVGDAALPGVSLGIDGGELSSSAPSTVFDPNSGEILREGAIPAARIRALIS